MGGCKHYFEELRNLKIKETNRRCDCVGPGSSKDQIKEVIEEGLAVKAVGCNEIPVGVWKYQGDMAAKLLTRLFNTMQQCEKKPGEYRRSLSLRRGKTCRCVAITRNYSGEPHNGVAGRSITGQTNSRHEHF